MKKSAWLVPVALLAVGCSGAEMNSPFKKYTQEEQRAATAARS